MKTDKRGHASFAATVVASAFLVFTASGQQPLVLTKALDASNLRPDGVGTFHINTITTPAYDGRWVVFRENGPADDVSLASIWSIDMRDGSFHKLAELNTPAPGGVGTFSNLNLQDTAPALRQGTVIFLARDSSSGQNPEGLYSVPASGGTITRIVDYSLADPSGGNFTVFDLSGKQVGGFSFDGTTVAFNAQSSAGTAGVYSAKPDGSALSLVSDNLHPYTAPGGQVTTISDPAISGSNVVMFGTDGTDPGTGYNGIYLGMAGGGAVTELLNSTQQLPGNPNSSFHTRFDAPVLALDGTLVAFRADDSRQIGFFGLYTTDLTSHSIAKIADANSTLPGLGKLTALADGGVAVSQGSVLFKASDNTGKTALYLWNNGAPARLIGAGDTIGGQTVKDIADPGPGALLGSDFVFNVDFGPPNGRAIYVATAPASAVTLAAVTNSASYGASSIAPGEIVTLFGTGMGPATLTYGQWTNNQLPTNVAGARVLFNGVAAPLIYVSEKQGAAIVPFAVVGPVQVTVEYNANVSAAMSLPLTNTMPGLFSTDFSGSGQGAIQNADHSYNSAANPAAAGSIVVLWTTGLGQLLPPQTDGAIVPFTTVEALPALQYPVSVTIGGQPAQIVYQGPAPLAVAGLYQVNCVVPTGTPAGNAAVVVTADGRQSQPNLTVAVQ